MFKINIELKKKAILHGHLTKSVTIHFTESQ